MVTRVCQSAALLPLAAILLSGCTVGPKYHRPTAPVPTATTYKEDPANFPEAQQVWKAADSNAAMLRGKFELTFEKEKDDKKKTARGRFTLIVRKFPDGWKIVHDHTSAEEVK